jgi:hypothetical protein
VVLAPVNATEVVPTTTARKKERRRRHGSLSTRRAEGQRDRECKQGWLAEVWTAVAALEASDLDRAPAPGRVFIESNTRRVAELEGGWGWPRTHRRRRARLPTTGTKTNWGVR